MSRELKVFSFNDSNTRVIVVDGEPWIVATDVAEALEYSEASRPSRLFQAVPDEWKGVKRIHTPGGEQSMLCLSEQGLYFFLGRSDKPKALPYQKWIAGEVVPSIRNKQLKGDSNMSNILQVFNNTEFGSIQILEEDGVVLFNATEVTRALGYEKPNNAINQHCRCALKRGIPHPQNPAKTIEMNFIPEPDLYRLICGSRLESAQRFERWVFEEVLPTIRKHGAYLTPAKLEEALLNPDTIIKLAQALKDEQEKRTALEAQAEADRPKVLFADAVSESKTSILIGNMAKLLRQNHIDIGQNRLFRWLRENGYLIKRQGSSYNMPTQAAMEKELFEVVERVYNLPDGSTRITRTVKVTGKGQVHLINKFIGSKEKKKKEGEAAA